MNVMYVRFNRFPEIEVRTVLNEDKEKLVISKDGECRTLEEDKQAFPFILKNDIIATVFLKSGSKFSFKMPEKYKWNGADIVKPLWVFVGSQFNPEYSQPSMVHDFMLENKQELMKEVGLNIDDYRQLTSDVFHSLLLQNGVKPLKASIMSGCVDMFQKYFNKRNWTK